MPETFSDQSNEDLAAKAKAISDELARRQVIAAAQAEKARYPIKTKFYLHSSKEDNWNQAAELKLNDAAQGTFAYTGLEVTLDIEIDEQGMAKATHINDIPISQPVDL